MKLSIKNLVIGTAFLIGTHSYAQVSNIMCGVIPGGTASVTVNGVTVTSHLPLTYLCTSEKDTPRTGPVILVPNGGSIQTTYNSAPCGAAIQLVADGHYTASGVNFIHKNCPNSQWIWFETAPNALLPKEGTATCPQYANVPSLADYGLLNCAPATVAGMAHVSVNTPFNISGDHVRVENIDFQNTGTTGINIMNLSGDHLVADRNWYHGSPGLDTARALALDGGSYIGVVENYFSDLHCTTTIGLCSQGQAINAQSALGIFTIGHNYISAAGEQILWGGGSNTFGTPSDIVQIYNHTFRPFAWDQVCTTSTSCPGGASYNGGAGGHPYGVLNNFEFKNAQRVLAFGNVLENVWGGFSQVGDSFIASPKNQAGANGTNLCPTCLVKDITYRDNLTTFAGQCYQIFNGSNANGAYALEGNNYVFYNNACIHAKYTGCYGCDAYLNELSTGLTAPSTAILHDVGFYHETQVVDNMTGMATMDLGAPLGAVQTNFLFGNSISPALQYGIGNIGGGSASCAFTPVTSTPKLSSCWNPVMFAYNGIAWGKTNGGTWNSCGVTPPAICSSDSNIKLADQNAIGFVDIANNNYRLSSLSPLYRKASDGTDIGADWTALNAQIQNAPFTGMTQSFPTSPSNVKATVN